MNLHCQGTNDHHHGTSQAHRYDDPKAYFRHQYYEVLDMTGGEIQNRFHQTRGMPVAAVLENTLLNAINSSDTDDSFNDIPEEINLYSKVINIAHLKIQLAMLPDLLRTYNENNPNARITKVTNLSTLGKIILNVHCSQIMLSEVSRLLSVTLTIPVTSASAERTFSSFKEFFEIHYDPTSS